jgi:hypothetical protein
MITRVRELSIQFSPATSLGKRTIGVIAKNLFDQEVRATTEGFLQFQ